MKTQDSFKFFASIFVFILLSCTNNNSEPEINEIIELPVFDTLQGTWSWYQTYDGKKGWIENDYQVDIKFININTDSTISFETYKNDTLFLNGDLTISVAERGYIIKPFILPNWTVFDEVHVYFFSKDTLHFYEKGCFDCNEYYYFKSSK
jgi:hypothetical protein